MKFRILIFSTIVGLLLHAYPAQAGQGEKKEAPAKAAPTAFDFRAHLQKLYDAWSDLDPAKAAPFYAKEGDHVFFDIAPLKYTGWTEYAEGVPKAFSAYSSGKFTLGKDLRVHRHGNLTWVTATWRAELLKKDGIKENAEGRYTAILEKRGDDWLIVHEHMSVPAPPPPATK